MATYIKPLLHKEELQWFLRVQILLNLAEDSSKGKDCGDLSISSAIYDPVSARAKFIRSTPALLTPVRNGSAQNEDDRVLLLGLVMLEMITGGLHPTVLARTHRQDGGNEEGLVANLGRDDDCETRSLQIQTHY